MSLETGGSGGYGSPPSGAVRVRKPYTMTKAREKWTADEHSRFIEAIRLYGRSWKKIEEHIGTKTAVQVRSHAQKFFTKVERKKEAGEELAEEEDVSIPPPRPKRKPQRPYPRKDSNSSGGAVATPTPTTTAGPSAGGEELFGTAMLAASLIPAHVVAGGPIPAALIDTAAHIGAAPPAAPALQALALPVAGPMTAIPFGGADGLGPLQAAAAAAGGLSAGAALDAGAEPEGAVDDATVAAVAAAATAAAAAAAAAVVAAAGSRVQSFLRANPPPGFPFFGMPLPAALDGAAPEMSPVPLTLLPPAPTAAGGDSPSPPADLRGGGAMELDPSDRSDSGGGGDGSGGDAADVPRATPHSSDGDSACSRENESGAPTAAAAAATADAAVAQFGTLLAPTCPAGAVVGATAAAAAALSGGALPGLTPLGAMAGLQGWGWEQWAMLCSNPALLSLMPGLPGGAAAAAAAAAATAAAAAVAGGLPLHGGAGGLTGAAGARANHRRATPSGNSDDSGQILPPHVSGRKRSHDGSGRDRSGPHRKRHTSQHEGTATNDGAIDVGADGPSTANGGAHGGLAPGDNRDGAPQRSGPNSNKSGDCSEQNGAAQGADQGCGGGGGGNNGDGSGGSGGTGGGSGTRGMGCSSQQKAQPPARGPGSSDAPTATHHPGSSAWAGTGGSGSGSGGNGSGGGNERSANGNGHSGTNGHGNDHNNSNNGTSRLQQIAPNSEAMMAADPLRRPSPRPPPPPPPLRPQPRLPTSGPPRAQAGPSAAAAPATVTARPAVGPKQRRAAAPADVQAGVPLVQQARGDGAPLQRGAAYGSAEQQAFTDSFQLLSGLQHQMQLHWLHQIHAAAAMAATGMAAFGPPGGAAAGAFGLPNGLPMSFPIAAECASGAFAQAVAGARAAVGPAAPAADAAAAADVEMGDASVGLLSLAAAAAAASAEPLD